MTPAILIPSIIAAGVIPHECGHALAAQAIGLPWRFRFGKFGPYTHAIGRYVWWENALVALGGPIGSFMAGWTVALCGLPATGLLIAGIGILNMIPLPGTDAWRVYEALQLRRVHGTA